MVTRSLAREFDCRKSVANSLKLLFLDEQQPPPVPHKKRQPNWPVQICALGASTTSLGRLYMRRAWRAAFVRHCVSVANLWQAMTAALGAESSQGHRCQVVVVVVVFD